MNLQELELKLREMLTVAEVVHYGNSLAVVDVDQPQFIFINENPQLVFSNGAEQITVWVVDGLPSVQVYPAGAFADALDCKLAKIDTTKKPADYYKSLAIYFIEHLATSEQVDDISAIYGNDLEALVSADYYDIAGDYGIGV